MLADIDHLFGAVLIFFAQVWLQVQWSQDFVVRAGYKNLEVLVRDYYILSQSHDCICTAERSLIGYRNSLFPACLNFETDLTLNRSPFDCESSVVIDTLQLLFYPE